MDDRACLVTGDMPDESLQTLPRIVPPYKKFGMTPSTCERTKPSAWRLSAVWVPETFEGRCTQPPLTALLSWKLRRASLCVSIRSTRMSGAVVTATKTHQREIHARCIAAICATEALTQGIFTNIGISRRVQRQVAEPCVVSRTIRLVGCRESKMILIPVVSTFFCGGNLAL